MSTLLIVTLIIVLIASLIKGVANVTTGITLSHTGFSPNANITATPALPSILQLYPLVFAFIGLAAVWGLFRSREGV